MKRHILSFIILLLYVNASASTVWIQKDTWHTGFANRPWEKDKFGFVFRKLIIPVVDSNVKKAENLLLTKQITELTIDQAKNLLSLDSLSPDLLIDEIILNEIKQAKEYEVISKKPFYANSSERFEKLSLYHEKLANTAKMMKGNLKPFLVRAIAFPVQTGNFSAYIKKNKLWIWFGCLGRKPYPMKRNPVIVFLEYLPEEVFIDVTIAE